MVSSHPLPRRHERHANGAPLQPQSEDGQHDLRSLVEENAQLRELVIQLSKLVVRNVIEQK